MDIKGEQLARKIHAPGISGHVSYFLMFALHQMFPTNHILLYI